jgi:CRISPR type III-A-associated protein Csm2
MSEAISNLKLKVEQAKNLLQQHERRPFEATAEVSKELNRNYKSYVKEIIVDNDPKALIVLAEGIAQCIFSAGIKTNQVRNIFGYVKKIEATEMSNTAEHNLILDKSYVELSLLPAKLAYIIGRAENYQIEALKLLKLIFDESVETIGKDKKKFKTFMDLFEAIVSYYRYYNPKQ